MSAVTWVEAPESKKKSEVAPGSSELMKRAIPLGAGASERDGQRLGRKMERKRWREAREIEWRGRIARNDWSGEINRRRDNLR